MALAMLWWMQVVSYVVRRVILTSTSTTPTKSSRTRTFTYQWGQDGDGNGDATDGACRAGAVLPGGFSCSCTFDHENAKDPIGRNTVLLVPPDLLCRWMSRVLQPRSTPGGSTPNGDTRSRKQREKWESNQTIFVRAFSSRVEIGETQEVHTCWHFSTFSARNSCQWYKYTTNQKSTVNFKKRQFSIKI